MNRRSSGFTLLEAMITLAIVAILASIAIPGYQNYINKSQVREAQSNLIALSLAVESSYQRTLSYHPNDLADTAAVKAVFTSWAPSSDSFKYSYKYDAGSYLLTAVGDVAGLTACSLTINEKAARSGGGANCGNVNW